MAPLITNIKYCPSLFRLQLLLLLSIGRNKLKQLFQTKKKTKNITFFNSQSPTRLSPADTPIADALAILCVIFDRFFARKLILLHFFFGHVLMQCPMGYQLSSYQREVPRGVEVELS